MKKMLIFLSALVLSLALCACAQQQAPEQAAPAPVAEYTFPQGTTVLGVDITGLTKDTAWSKLEETVANYKLELTVDGVSATLTAADMDLSCAQDVFMVDAERMSQGLSAEFANLIRFNEGKLRSWMQAQFNKPAVDGSIVFDDKEDKYVTLPHAEGQSSNPNELVIAVKDSILTLNPQQTLTEVSQILKPARSSEAKAVKKAVSLANKMIGVKLAYVFSPDGDEKITVEIPAKKIRSFVTLDEDGLTPIINESKLDDYVAELSEKYSEEGTEGDFVTTSGDTIGFTVSYNGHEVDAGELAQDIATCMKKGISETRTAPYYDSGEQDMPYGGTYVEVDLSSQHLWFYKNGERLVSASIVSGKVAEGWMTPTGVYSLYEKDAAVYLEGEDYSTFVNYWMPFLGGYGLHDAVWRGSFGSDIYHYDGSHGCVNMPYDAASTLYNNISVGTKVILYGGRTSVPPLTQTLSGTTSYDVADDDDAFKLNIRPEHSEPKMSYSSSNTKVATVSSDGTVTIKGIGTATITVKAAEHKYYTDAQIKVTINVHSACEEGRHKMGKPKTVKEPTCQPGLQKTSCSKCKHYTEEELEPTKSHSYGEWKTTKKPTCVDEGTKERTCTVCKKSTETGSVAATGKHKESGWQTVKSPTCAEDGSKIIQCTVCEKTLKTESIAATGNHTAGDWETVKDATCTKDGKKAKFCTVCEKQLDTGTIAAGHTPGDWITVTEPKCTEDGLRALVCAVCGEHLQTETIPGGHTPGEWVETPSTCTQPGSKTQSCVDCETVLDSVTLDTIPHSFAGNGPTCDYCSEPNPNYQVPEPQDPSDPSTPTT